jgi:very-short-patch-repair endonuclease
LDGGQHLGVFEKLTPQIPNLTSPTLLTLRREPRNISVSQRYNKYMDDKFLYNHKDLRERRRKLRNNQTPAEKILWKHISKNQICGTRFSRQYSAGPYIIDFFCSKIKLGIELDGSPHTKGETRIYDKDREKYLKSLDIEIVRFWNDEVLKNTKEVLYKLNIKIEKLINKYESPSP